MSRVAYVNGRYLPFAQACVHIEDRGYQFADGVYEVCKISAGRLLNVPHHLARLQRSLEGLRIRMPVGPAALEGILHEVARRNRIVDGLVYLQISRGVARRDHAFPPQSVRPSLVVTARAIDGAKAQQIASQGISVVTVPDNRWERVDIKSVALLPNVLAKQSAREQGAAEAWFVAKDGFVTEGSSSNAWIVTTDGRLVTRPSSTAILTGVTRTILLEELKALQLQLDERPFTVAEAQAAGEAFNTSAGMGIVAVVRIDGRNVGNGAPGPVSRRLRDEFPRFAHFS